MGSKQPCKICFHSYMLTGCMHAELLNRHPQVSDRNVLHYTGTKDDPARQINLRAIDPERYTIVNEANNGEVLEEIEESNAFWEVYDGAVYLYQVRTPLGLQFAGESACRCFVLGCDCRRAAGLQYTCKQCWQSCS